MEKTIATDDGEKGVRSSGFFLLTVTSGTHFSLIRDEDLIRVDHNGKVVEGGKNKRLNYGT